VLLPRVLDNYLEAWDEFVSPRPAPDLFKKWGGLALISAALTRKVWVQTNPSFPPLYPVIYALLVGPPGSGKDMIINLVREILIAASADMGAGKGFNVGPESFSVKGLIDALADDNAAFTFEYRDKGKKEIVTYNSLIIANAELGTFLPEYNTHLISCINDLYNGKPTFSDRVRGRGNISTVTITNPHLMLLLGTQPATLMDIVPEQAFGMGFTSRINMIVAKEAQTQALFSNTTINASSLFTRLTSDIKSIASLTGPFKANTEFKKLINDFHINNPDKIAHSRFEDYNTRRSLHLCKLAMIYSAAQGNTMQLTAEHFHVALATLLEAEAVSPLVFENLKTNTGFSHTVEQVLHNTGATITQAMLERKLRLTHKPYEVGQIIRSMIAAGDLEPVVSKTGQTQYIINKDVEQTINEHSNLH